MNQSLKLKLIKSNHTKLTKKGRLFIIPKKRNITNILHTYYNDITLCERRQNILKKAYKNVINKL